MTNRLRRVEKFLNHLFAVGFHMGGCLGLIGVAFIVLTNFQEIALEEPFAAGIGTLGLLFFSRLFFRLTKQSVVTMFCEMWGRELSAKVVEVERHQFGRHSGVMVTYRFQSPTRPRTCYGTMFCERFDLLEREEPKKKKSRTVKILHFNDRIHMLAEAVGKASN